MVSDHAGELRVLLGTLANDGDHVDVFIGPKPEAGMFWVINQNKGRFVKYDEPKVMLGYERGICAGRLSGVVLRKLWRARVRLDGRPVLGCRTRQNCRR